MAYEKQTWACGDTVTADKLNHMEDGIADASGFECTETRTLLTDETVTTESIGGGMSGGGLTYSDPITADAIFVTFDGTEYECEKKNIDGDYYGATPTKHGFDFSEYPFCISCDNGNFIITQTEGSHTIKIEVAQSEITAVSPCFKLAVKKANEPLIVSLNIPPTGSSSSTPSVADITADALLSELKSGRVVFFNWEDEYYSVMPCGKKRFCVTAKNASDSTSSLYTYGSGASTLICPPPSDQ